MPHTCFKTCLPAPSIDAGCDAAHALSFPLLKTTVHVSVIIIINIINIINIIIVIKSPSGIASHTSHAHKTGTRSMQLVRP